MMRQSEQTEQKFQPLLILLLSFVPIFILTKTTSEEKFGVGLVVYGMLLVSIYGVAYLIAKILYLKSVRAQVDRAKDDFVSFASHQLRTPLTNIVWRTEMLLEGEAGKLTKKQKEYLNEIQTGTKAMTDLIGAFLNVSRINLGTLPKEPHPCDVPKIIDSILNENESVIREKKMRIIKKYGASSSRHVTQDPRWLRIIIQNLFSNALLYTPKNGTITVVLKIQSDSLLLSIEDTGIGIPIDSQSHIFTRLFRSEISQKSNPDGNGLGLYIVKLLVERSGGRVWFTSTEGVGTTFYVMLPLREKKIKTASSFLSLPVSS